MEENNKFWNLNGYIGRRGFIINLILVIIVELITFVSPFAFVLLSSPDLMHDFLQLNLNFHSLPGWIIIWIILASLCKYILLYPSVVRRVRDILGEDNSKIIPIVITALFIMFIGGSIPFVKYLYCFSLIYLMCMAGQISGERPKSEIIKFNWGACLGTWIWGLYNKSYKTLWLLLLWPLTGILPFMLLFGMKGNEWAYKNKNYESIDAFHKAQSNQAIIWAISFPFVIIASVILVFSLVGNFLNLYNKYHPEFKSQVASYYVKMQNSNAEAIFKEIDIKTDCYIFKLDPVFWDKLSQSRKHHLYEMAAYYAASNTDKNYVVSEANLKVSAKVLNKVKIISTFNEEILAQCENLKNYNEYPQECVFNSHPSLP